MIRLPHAFTFPGAPSPDVQAQPAGFDLSVSCISKFSASDSGVLDFANTRRLLPALTELNWQAEEDNSVEFVELQPGGYLVTYNEEVSIPLDCAAVVLPRSSLMRCGAVLHSALWDPGYKGRGQGLLTVYSPLRLYKNARIGQMVFFALEKAVESGYVGTYQGERL